MQFYNGAVFSIIISDLIEMTNREEIVWFVNLSDDDAFY